MRQRILDAAYLLISQSILSVAIHDLAGWEPAGESLYHALGRDALEKEGTPVLRRNIMEEKRYPYLSVGIDIGADFSLMAIVLPTQAIIGKPYKTLHSNNRSVQGAVERILSMEEAYELPVRVYMESTGILPSPPISPAQERQAGRVCSQSSCNPRQPKHQHPQYSQRQAGYTSDRASGIAPRLENILCSSG